MQSQRIINPNKIATMKFIIALSTILATINALPVANSPSTGIVARQTGSQAVTDKLLFSTSMADFQKARDAKDPSNLIWDSNGCTASPDRPFGYDFLQSCQRHDFGYRNYKAQGRFSEDNKDKIDSNFRQDLYNECDKKSVVSRAVCRGTAKIYYEAVSSFGGKRDLSSRR